MHIPEIAPSLRISEFMKIYMDEQIFFADEHSKMTTEGAPINMDNVSFIKKMASRDEPLILIGPEGGFTETEREDLLKMPKLMPICLGEAVLRAEIAAGTAVSLVQLLRSQA